MRIAIVEDEEDLRVALARALKREGYEADAFPDAAEALLFFRERVPDLCILDWMLPGMSGLDLCRILRQDQRFRDTAILFLTARTQEMDVVLGLETGADDYVIKPFRMRELMARIKVLLRRHQSGGSNGTLRRGDLWLDRLTYQAGFGDAIFSVTPTEWRLLELLTRHPGRVYTRSQILNALWPDDRDVEDRTVDVHVARLRDKMGDAQTLVETVRGIGYRLKDTPSP